LALAIFRLPRPFLALVIAALATLGGAGGPAAADTPAAQPPAATGAAAVPAAAAAEPPKPVVAPLPVEVATSIERVLATMEQAEKMLARIKDLGDDIGRVRDEVESVISNSTEVADGLRPRLAEIDSQIAKLGPPPAKDAPPEAPTVAAERARLNAESSAVSGAIKTLELTWVRARQAIDKITDLRLSIFTRSLMERMSSPVFPAIWNDVIRDAPQVGRLVKYITSDWLNTASRKGWQALVPMLAGLLVWLVGRRLVRRLVVRAPTGGAARPSFFERAARAAWVAPMLAAPGVAAALIIYFGLDILGLLYYPSDKIAASTLRAVLIFVAVSALIRAVLAPERAERRLVDFSDQSARRVTRLLQAISAVSALDLALTAISRALYVPLSLSVVQSLLTSVTLAGLLALLLSTPFEPMLPRPGLVVSRHTPRWVKAPLWVVVALIVGVSLLGYVALARFLAQQLVMTGIVAMVATLLFLAIRAFTREPEDAEHPIGRMLESRFGIDAPRRHQIGALTELALTFILMLATLPVLLLQWGFSGAEIRDWVKAGLFGFEVGQFKISLARILIGIVLFTALLFTTRLFQRWLRETLFRQPRMDAGIANSIDTAVGYAGIAVSALIAISYAGLDITNLAIVAGALSVGIGFGLQSIVNNFVSGLILLVERPIKVGDWIVVGNEQGNVEKISVRSTEIRTFDGASLIVPNSELVTGRVLNWTHRGVAGRLVVKVGVGYDADPRRVSEMLVAVAKAQPGVAARPAPKALLENFGPKALEMSLRVYLEDITHEGEIKSDLRIAIHEALLAAKVTIPTG
jgi:small-conductance mechanosensitive channel